MADREYIVTFDGDEARVALAAGTKMGSLQTPARYRATTTKFAGAEGEPPYVNVSAQNLHPDEYHVLAPDSRRAELIARAMRKK